MICFSDDSPVIVGALGGSGTRVVAHLLTTGGIYLGSDLNDAQDNLLATLLFNRRSALLETKREFSELLQILYLRMKGETDFTHDEIARLEILATKERQQHTREFLELRLHRFRNPGPEPVRQGRWGWKMPPSHVLLPRLLELDPSLKYIHLVRHGLDMAFSPNQNQLKTWGPVVLDRDVEISPRDSLSYWCETQARVKRISEQYPSSILEIKFEQLCEDPIFVGRKVFKFLDHAISDAALSTFADFVKPPKTLGRYKSQDLSIFRQADLMQLEGEGYRI